MVRLPKEGGDVGVWGTILNEYLLRAHNTDGTLRAGSVSATTLAPNTVINNLTASLGSANDGDVLTVNSGAANGLAWSPPAAHTSDTVVVAKNSNNTWPARPSATTVIWVGVGTPDPSTANSNDIWIDTTP